MHKNADRTLSIDPKNIIALVTKSKATINLDKFEECIISAYKAIKINPKRCISIKK